jgi:perosamine synthetase
MNKYAYIMIPLDSPLLDGNEKKYLNQCIDTNWISWQGEFVNKLETDIATYCGTKHGITIVNGTYALIVALRALGIGPGDEVIVPALTMSASTFAISSVGAIPVWCDTAPNSLTLDVADVERKINNKTKAVMAVHLYGYAVDMPALLRVTQPLNIPVIEDAAESFGATIDGKPVGGWGTIACHSFHNKIIGSGEGGAITVNDDTLALRCLNLRTPPPDNAGGTVFALNNRMSNLAAAVALAQLERIDTLIASRRRVATIYNECFAGMQFFTERANESSVYWRYQLLVDNNKELAVALKERGIEARPIFTLMSSHPLYKDTVVELPNSEYVSSRGIDLPSGPALTDSQIRYVADTVKELVQ